MPAYYLKFLGGADKVKHFVGFGANYKGTTLNGLDTLIRLLAATVPGLADIVDSACGACLEYIPGSQFLADLNAGGVAVDGVNYTNIVSRYDTVVTPYTSGTIPGANVTNIVLQDRCFWDFSGHLSQAIDPNVSTLILNALDPANPRPLRCVPFFAPA